MPEDDIGAMLGGNAVDFYGLDGAALDEAASRVGPREADFAA